MSVIPPLPVAIAAAGAARYNAGQYPSLAAAWHRPCSDEWLRHMTNESIPIPNTSKKPLALIILDGWGYREDKRDNAIANANTPTWDHLWASAPHTLVHTSGLDVGLPDGQMGNSEVGHMSIGSGRIVYQHITRIDRAIEDGSFFSNSALVEAVETARARNSAIHVLGLLSPGGVHSHEHHLHAAVDLAAQRGVERIHVHAFLDGRDTPPRSARASLQRLTDHCAQRGGAHVASIIGRYYAMDRDHRWERIEQAYRLLTEGHADFHAENAVAGLEAAYARGEDDEFVQATAIVAANGSITTIDDGDVVLFMNFRADRARELCHAFLDEPFDGFPRIRHPRLAAFVTATEYAAELPATVAFPTDDLHNTLGEYLASRGLTQLRIAETEKYAHVTFFFSGGREALYAGEERILVPSPQVATYDLKPEMSAPEVTDQLVEAIRSGRFDVIVCNYANGDMVGHTGSYPAAVQAVEAVDQCLQRVIDALAEVGGEALITADHGNCEQMQDYDSGQLHTQHTTGPVPFLYVGPRQVEMRTRPGRLADVAPTMLSLLGLPQPADMTGEPLLKVL